MKNLSKPYIPKFLVRAPDSINGDGSAAAAAAAASGAAILDSDNFETLR